MNSNSPKRVLFISYPFPPVGGAGVQRTTKFVKYLSEFGWLSSVLTVANPSVPALDHSLVKDVPAHTLVRRARTWEPSYSAKSALAGAGNGEARRTGNLKGMLKSAVHWAARLALQPDPQILWMPGAIGEGRKLLAEAPHSAIVASGPPFSTFLIGASLSRHSGLPLVLDYRDEWDISNAYLENKRLDRFSLSLQSRMQRSVVRTARVLMATTRCSANALNIVRERARSKAEVTWIYNGYDPEDFQGAQAEPASAKQTYQLAYVGTLWNLTSAEPLVAAVERLSERNPQQASRLELIFAGRRTPQQSEILARLKRLPAKLVEIPYVDHHGAVNLVRSADGLCVLLSDVRAAERVVPAKIFEYMAAGRAIIGIGPKGEMWELLRECPAARLNEPKDVDGIADTLSREIQRVSAGRALELNGWNPSAYDRRSEAGQLAGILNSIC